MVSCSSIASEEPSLRGCRRSLHPGNVRRTVEIIGQVEYFFGNSHQQL